MPGGEEATDVGRLVVMFLRWHLVTVFFSFTFPFDDGSRGDPRDLYSDEGTAPPVPVSSISIANLSGIEVPPPSL